MMELGKRILEARLEAGMSQRQLCGETITRNMLSQIEHGTANPSVATLQYLAARLGKSVSYFLEEDALTTPNQAVMARARAAFDSGDFPETVKILEEYRQPDDVYDREMHLMGACAYLQLAEAAGEQGRELYALELLEKAREHQEKSTFFAEELQRKRLILLGKIRKRNLSEIAELLPSMDEELLLRAQGALEKQDPVRCGQLLDAVEDKPAPRWNLLRGQVYLMGAAYQQAAECFRRAEEAYPEETAKALEACYRELGDFKQAYFYACKQKG
jgi:transcriptional regulator with XRE-family HTH domain